MVVSSSSSSLPPNLNSLVNVKLDSSNYIIWKNQIQNLFQATELLGYIDGSVPCPLASILDSSNKSIENPDFRQWKIIDAHLLSCLTSTLSPSIFSSVLHLKQSAEVWLALERRFTALSRSHVHQLKNKLQAIKKKSQSMEAYLHQFKEISDQFALASHLLIKRIWCL
mgnify:CR=1 FL=1